MRRCRCRNQRVADRHVGLRDELTTTCPHFLSCMLKIKMWAQRKLGGDTSYWHEAATVVTGPTRGQNHLLHVGTCRKDSSEHFRSHPKASLKVSETTRTWHGVLHATSRHRQRRRSKIIVRFARNDREYTWKVAVCSSIVGLPSDSRLS